MRLIDTYLNRTEPVLRDSPARRWWSPLRNLVYNRFARFALLCVAGFYLAVSLSMLTLRWWTPPTTGIQIQRQLESWWTKVPFQKQYLFVPLSDIAPELQQAVITAEDKHFFAHHGFEWDQINKKARIYLTTGRKPAATSTITQQLIKNLFFTTKPSVFRKALESLIVPIAEVLLPKRRILELYLNVIEWGPGLFGAEAAARHYYNVNASSLTRAQAVDLAAMIPSPRRRTPGSAPAYSRRISDQMRDSGW